jgi:hypothetical protein
VKDVAKGRGVTEARVRNSFGKRRMMPAQEARTAGLVDGIRTLPATLAYLGIGSPSSSLGAASPSRSASASAFLASVNARARIVEANR